MASVMRPGEEKIFEGQPRGFPFGEFDVADVMLPEGDTMGIHSEEEEEEEELVQETGFGNIVGKLIDRTYGYHDEFFQMGRMKFGVSSECGW